MSKIIKTKMADYITESNTAEEFANATPQEIKAELIKLNKEYDDMDKAFIAKRKEFDKKNQEFSDKLKQKGGGQMSGFQGFSYDPDDTTEAQNKRRNELSRKINALHKLLDDKKFFERDNIPTVVKIRKPDGAGDFFPTFWFVDHRRTIMRATDDENITQYHLKINEFSTRIEEVDDCEPATKEELNAQFKSFFEKLPTHVKFVAEVDDNKIGDCAMVDRMLTIYYNIPNMGIIKDYNIKHYSLHGGFAKPDESAPAKSAEPITQEQAKEWFENNKKK